MPFLQSRIRSNAFHRKSCMFSMNLVIYYNYAFRNPCATSKALILQSPKNLDPLPLTTLLHPQLEPLLPPPKTSHMTASLRLFPKTSASAGPHPDTQGNSPVNLSQPFSPHYLTKTPLCNPANNNLLVKGSGELELILEEVASSSSSQEDATFSAKVVIVRVVFLCNTDEKLASASALFFYFSPEALTCSALQYDHYTAVCN